VRLFRSRSDAVPGVGYIVEVMRSSAARCCSGAVLVVFRSDVTVAPQRLGSFGLGRCPRNAACRASHELSIDTIDARCAR
jgi:hypothetical protein